MQTPMLSAAAAGERTFVISTQKPLLQLRCNAVQCCAVQCSTRATPVAQTQHCHRHTADRHMADMHPHFTHQVTHVGTSFCEYCSLRSSILCFSRLHSALSMQRSAYILFPRLSLPSAERTQQVWSSILTGIKLGQWHNKAKNQSHLDTSGFICLTSQNPRMDVLILCFCLCKINWH